MIVVRLQLPVRSPYPLMVPCTWTAPPRTPASALATPVPASSWRCTPTPTSLPKYSTTARTMCSIWSGNEPPLVSHSTSRLAPACTAPSSTRIANSGLRL